MSITALWPSEYSWFSRNRDDDDNDDDDDDYDDAIVTHSSGNDVIADGRLY